MTVSATASAEFIFDGQPNMALPRMMDLLRSSLRAEDAVDGRITDASLAALTFAAPGLTLHLSLVLSGIEARVTLSLTTDGRDAPLARLAALAYTLAKATDVAAVVWHGTTLRIPRATFVAGLAHSLEPAAQIIPRTEPTPRVAPRRVAQAAATSARPERRKLRLVSPHFDAHVTTFEAHLRSELRRPATNDELDTLRAAYEPEKNRMSALTTGASAALQSAELRAASLVICVTSLVVTSGATNLV